MFHGGSRVVEVGASFMFRSGRSVNVLLSVDKKCLFYTLQLCWAFVNTSE